jgi:hypothetical protein
MNNNRLPKIKLNYRPIYEDDLDARKLKYKIKFYVIITKKID